MKYNLAWLKAKYENNETIKYLFFWGHQPSKDGSITKTCFSQWWLEDFVVEGIRYPSAEHWMMVCKARLFDDYEVLENVLRTKSPAEAKKLGRQVKNFMPTIWDEHKYEFVKQGNLHKFGQNQALGAFLIQTADRVIVEASPVDTIWGIGLAADDDAIENPLLWKGENLLGFALMEVRDILSK